MPAGSECGYKLSGAVADSFAPIFYRNVINMGLPIFESPEAAKRLADGDELEVDQVTGTTRNLTKKESYSPAAYLEFIQEIIAAGGMINYVKQRLA